MTEKLEALLLAERQQVAANLRLLERVATAANEASSAEEAFTACLVAVCDHAGWAAAHVHRRDAAGALRCTGPWHGASAARLGRVCDAREGRCALVDAVAETGSPQFVDPGDQGASRIREDGFERAAAFPVHLGSRVEAVLVLHTGAAAPVQEDREILVQLMAQLATQLGRVLERENAELERAELESQLRQSQKMEAVGRLAGGVAHDFNNLLTTITGVADLLMPTIDEEDPRRAEVEAIQKAALQAADLTRQLLAFSRRQVLQPRVIDLAELLGDMEKMLCRVIGEHVALVTETPEGLGRVKADPGQLEQVLMNLAINARDAMPEGGRVTLSVEDVVLGEWEAMRIGQIAPGAYVLLTVADDGQGMDEETRLQVFEPFFTTKETGKGTGLGLSTVYGIVTQSGGRITVDSRPGRGTTFRIYLPRVEQAVEARPETGALTTERLGGPETVLIVEDGEAVRRLTKRLLEAVGYQVLTAHDGYDALDLLGRHPGAIDLLLTDVVMPHMNGVDLASAMTRHRPGLKVLYMSGYTADAIAHHGVLEPEVNFLEKPFRVEALLAKVRQVIDASARPPPRPGQSLRRVS